MRWILIALPLLLASPAGALTGTASWYGRYHEGKTMANGQRFHAHRLSAASRTLPLGSWVRVTNRHNGRSVILPVTDRGPYVAGRILDVSEGAANRLGFHQAGTAAVHIERIAHHSSARRTRHHVRTPARGKG